MKLVIGLGNPGTEYEQTRHNFGARVLEFIAGEYTVDLKKHRTKSLIAKTTLGSEEVVLAKMLCYMNESGAAVAALLKYFKIKPEGLIIIYDDIDLPFGSLRISQNPSSGGHKGIQSILDTIKSDSFERVRLGIAPQQGKAEEYVLKQWSREQKEKLPEILNKAKQALETLIAEGLAKAASKFN